MGLQGVSQTSIALLRPGEELDQGCSLLGISLLLLLHSSRDTMFGRAGDEPGISNTLLDDGTVGESVDIKTGLGGEEPGHRGDLKLSLSWTAERKIAANTVGVGREEDQGGLSRANQGLRLLLFLFSVVQT